MSGTAALLKAHCGCCLKEPTCTLHISVQCYDWGMSGALCTPCTTQFTISPPETTQGRTLWRTNFSNAQWTFERGTPISMTFPDSVLCGGNGFTFSHATVVLSCNGVPKRYTTINAPTRTLAFTALTLAECSASDVCDLNIFVMYDRGVRKDTLIKPSITFYEPSLDGHCVYGPYPSTYTGLWLVWPPVSSVPNGPTQMVLDGSSSSDYGWWMPYSLGMRVSVTCPQPGICPGSDEASWIRAVSVYQYDICPDGHLVATCREFGGNTISFTMLDKCNIPTPGDRPAILVYFDFQCGATPPCWYMDGPCAE